MKSREGYMPMLRRIIEQEQIERGVEREPFPVDCILHPWVWWCRWVGRWIR